MEYVFDGKVYKTLASCYKNNRDKTSVTIATVRNRLKNGWPIDRALLSPKEKTITSKLGEHIIEGVSYENLPSISEEYGIPLNTIYKRYSRGFRNDDLIPLRKRKNYLEPEKQNKNKFFVNGIGYKSAADACRKLNIKYVTFRKKINDGLTVNQALGIDKIEDGRVARGNKFDIDGTLKTIKELSGIFKISGTTIRDRLQRGATIRQAVGLDGIPPKSILQQKDIPKKKRVSIRLEVDGEIFNSYKALATKYGLQGYVVRDRIVNFGYSPEDAVKIGGKSKPISVRGFEYPSRAALAEAFGLTPEVLLARLANSESIEQAVGLEKKQNKNNIFYEDESFESLKDLALKKGVPIGSLRSRLKSGLSLKESLDAGNKILNIGRYNLTILERNSKLANKPAKLYFVRIFFGEIVRFKIGITTKSVSDRLRQSSYKFEIIKTYEDSLINCFKLEQNLINVFSSKRDFDVTSEMLDGYSEIFNLEDDDIKKILRLIEST